MTTLFYYGEPAHCSYTDLPATNLSRLYSSSLQLTVRESLTRVVTG